MVDQSASGAAVAPADRAAVTRRVRDAGAGATSQEAVGPGSAGATDTVVQGAHPAIIEPATFTAAERLLAVRGEARTHRAASSSEYHLTGRIRCPHCKKGFIGTAAHGRSKTYRYYTCWSRARYGTTTCNADRLNADAADQALFAKLAAFYRTERHLIAAAASEADTTRHAATDRHRAELTAVEKEITRTGTAIDRYLSRFLLGDVPAILRCRKPDPGHTRRRTIRRRVHRIPPPQPNNAGRSKQDGQVRGFAEGLAG